MVTLIIGITDHKGQFKRVEEKQLINTQKSELFKEYLHLKLKPNQSAFFIDQNGNSLHQGRRVLKEPRPIC